MSYLSINNQTDVVMNIIFHDSQGDEIPGYVAINPYDEVSHKIDEDHTNAGTLEMSARSSIGTWSGSVPVKIKESISIAKNEDSGINISYQTMNIPGHNVKTNNTFKWVVLFLFIIVICIAALFYFKKRGKD